MAASVSTKAVRELTVQVHRVEAKVDILLAHIGAEVPTHSRIVFAEDGELLEHVERGHLKGPLAKIAARREWSGDE